jgi:hypothetical protein
MKCIRCDHDSKYSERPGKVCPKCHQSFAFEPRANDMFTDMAFKHAIDAVSADGKVRWGVEHLHYELCRRKKKSAAILVIAVLLLLIAAACVVSLFTVRFRMGTVVFAAAVTFGAYHAFIAFLNAKFQSINQSAFDLMWKRWIQVHGAPPSVITRMPQAPKPRIAESDIGDYSFDRAVICDRARTVDLLLANNFHFENNCAVLSIEGYPPGPFETVRAMLKRNPRLQVFVLHDCTPQGCAVAHRLKFDQSWFSGGVRIIDVGLRPHQTQRFKGLFAKMQAGTVAATHGISANEAEWLSKNALELAAIRPEQVLKRLFRAINHLPEEPLKDAKDFSSDAGDSDGSFDSFG